MADRPLRTVFSTYVAVSLLTFGVTRFRSLPFLADYVGVAVAAIFLGAALFRVGRTREALERYGIALGGLLAPAEEHGDAGPLGLYDLARLLRDNAGSMARETGVALLLAALFFPPFLWGFGFWNGLEDWPAWNPPETFLSFCAAQIIVVAIPEEAFFRGFVQTDLQRHFNRDDPARLHVGALLLQAALFALVHFVVDLNPARLAVFFPGLLFGLIRHQRGGIGAQNARAKRDSCDECLFAKDFSLLGREATFWPDEYCGWAFDVFERV